MSSHSTTPQAATPATPEADPRPLVISLCGTYLKPEMQSIYRQITGLSRVPTIVYAQWLENEAMFPFPRITRLTKLHHRPRGNFLLRFWYKYIVRQWPPPVAINKFVGPCHPWDLIDHLRADSPALVHAYYGHKAVGYLPMLREWGGPWIVSFHGVDVARDVDKPEHAAALLEVFAEAQLVLARSQSLLQRLRELGCPEDKLRLNRTPIPLDDIQTNVRKPPLDGEWRLVQACRLIEKKGLMTTLAAIEKLTRDPPSGADDLPLFASSIKIKWVLCGDGPMAEKLRAAIAERGLQDHVELRGWLDQRELLAEYQRAHLFLHPSEKTAKGDQEGIPNSMLEAMATGLPVVATRHGGIPEAVTDRHDGLLAPEKDPEALAAAIRTLLTDPDKLSQFSANATASVRANFGSRQQIARLEDCYLEAIERWRAAQATTQPATQAST